MSPRKHNFRNRKRIKTPKRFEDADIISPHRQESCEESKGSSELEEEVYKSPKPRNPKPKSRAYRGKVIEFNPNLPPAAFPTLDHPDYVHNGGRIAVDLEPQLNPRLTGFEAINPDSLASGCHQKKVELTEDLPTMTTATTDFTHQEPQSVMQTSTTIQNTPRASVTSSMYGESTDNGPQNPIWASNMARMEEAGRMNDLDRNILEMETSDEDDSTAKRAAPARKASEPEFPDWDKLTVTHKLDLADAIAELYPGPEEVMHQLRLDIYQITKLAELLVEREDRAAREEAGQQRLREQVNNVLLEDRHLPQSKFQEMVEENIYGDIQKDDHVQTNLMELKKARAYLRYCGLWVYLSHCSNPSVYRKLSRKTSLESLCALLTTFTPQAFT